MRGSINPQNCNDVIKANAEPLRKKMQKKKDRKKISRSKKLKKYLRNT